MDMTQLAPHQKVLITGTGRSGTSFTMQVLTALGLPTGFESPGQNFFPTRMCGQEVTIPLDTPIERMGDYPQIVKDPRFLNTLRSFLDAGTLDPVHVYVLIRDVSDAARSRVDRRMVWDPVENTEQPPFVAAGSEVQLHAQTDRLYAGLGMLLETLALFEVSRTTVLFPRLALDADYFADSFAKLLAGVDRARVLDVHQQLAKPEAIHYGLDD